MYTVEFTRKATRQFNSFPKLVRDAIRKKLDRLAKDPRAAQEVKALRGEDGYRLRVGDYRVVYELNDGRLLIVVVRVAHRREVYR